MNMLSRITAFIFRDSPPIQVRVPFSAIFQVWVQQVAERFGAEVHQDENGAALLVHAGGQDRRVLMMLDGDTIHVRVLSNVNFPPGEIPPSVASFLADRNKTLAFDWDALSNERRSYFFVKAHGRMAHISVEAVKEVIEKMLPEVYALDRTLEEQGFVR